MSDVGQQLDADDLTLGLGPIVQHGDSATARFNATVNLGPGGAAWNYQGAFALRKLEAGWKVIWSPAVIVPGLRPGLRMAVFTSVPPRAALLDSAGSPLAQPSPAFVVGVHPGRLTQPGATAADLAKVTGLDASQVLGEIEVAPAASFLELVTAQAERVSAAERHRLSRIPGLIINEVRSPAVRQHRRSGLGLRRYRDRAGAARLGRPVPARHHGRAVRPGAGVPAHPGRHAHHLGRHREPGGKGGIGTEEAGPARQGRR